jgi:hypothetical protein
MSDPSNSLWYNYPNNVTGRAFMQVFGTIHHTDFIYNKILLTPRPNPKVQDHAFQLSGPACATLRRIWRLSPSVNRERTMRWSRENRSIKTWLPYYMTSQVLGQRWSPQLTDRGSDNALSVQGYRTTQGAMIDEHGSMLEWWLEGENWRNSKNPS